jgi:hypothetical protein
MLKSVSPTFLLKLILCESARPAPLLPEAPLSDQSEFVIVSDPLTPVIYEFGPKFQFPFLTYVRVFVVPPSMDRPTTVCITSAPLEHFF